MPPLHIEQLPATYKSVRVQNAVLKFSDAEREEVIEALRIGYCEGVLVIDRIRLRHMSFAEVMAPRGGDQSIKAA